MKLPVIAFNPESFSPFGEAIQKEWLITNGLGGYASSTVLGINTRKYHGLLVAALHPPGDRTVCLSKLDEDITLGKDFYQLGANEFRDVIYPQGYKLLKAFTIAPFPTYSYGFSDITVQKTVFMPKNKNGVSVIYRVSNKNSLEAKFRIYPLLTCRHFHIVLDQWRNPLYFSQKSVGNELEISFQNPEATFLCRSTDGVFKEKINWVDHLFYRAEASRGEASIDDCFQSGCFEVSVSAQEEKSFAVTAVLSSEDRTSKETLSSIGSTIDEVNATLNQELAYKSDLLDAFYSLHIEVPKTDWLNWILLAADSFILQNEVGKKSVIAGYFWFEPWGRDTFISLPGLMLVTGRFSDAKDILQSFIKYCKNGLIPNYVSDKSGEPAYNTVDATLWYVNAVLQYIKYTGDFGFVQEELWGDLQAIIDYHERGTLFGIRLDYDGLLSHGSRLTWMDAAVGGKEITPRIGKAVEIQALWYNALRIMQLLANSFGEKALAQKYAEMADKTSVSFNEKFWNTKIGCLYDVLDTSNVDTSLRPNQIFAVSLDFTMLDKDKSEKVVNIVNRELATPYGLRTLALSDPKFVGKCFGDRLSRDTAYHNGTIWPWLLGPFVKAYLKINGYSDESRDYAMKNLILPLFSSGINHAGLGTLSEIYDCDSPNTPRGCISQAWSVAEPLRAYVEDVLLVKPRYWKENLGT
ncbi:MAG: amylo-alpha-1,6-glucosidase [Candidatus Bathyarchaeia archaeon]|jgi:predicted glycogen debranching enzyme